MIKAPEKFPAEQDYVMPAEWDNHSATLLIWPHNRETWPGNRLKAVEKVYRQLVRTLLKYEPVMLLAVDPDTRQRALSVIGSTENLPCKLRIDVRPVNDVWARDSGPIFIKKRGKKTVALTDWEFNSWGGKYAPWDDDNEIPIYISEQFGIPRFSSSAVLEGGSVETNGEGLFITTESVLLNPNRNPDLSKDQIERLMYHYLGAKKVIWLKAGLTGDDTDGHIDDLTRFVNKNSVVTAVTEDQDNPNYKILRENREILYKSTDLDGNPLNVISIPLPDTKVQEQTVDGSDHVPSSYANFYIANGAVLLPLYNEEDDRFVLNLFSELFPDRIIEGIPCKDLVWGQGSIHCITQQMYGTEF